MRKLFVAGSAVAMFTFVQGARPMTTVCLCAVAFIRAALWRLFPARLPGRQAISRGPLPRTAGLRPQQSARRPQCCHLLPLRKHRRPQQGLQHLWFCDPMPGNNRSGTGRLAGWKGEVWTRLLPSHEPVHADMDEGRGSRGGERGGCRPRLFVCLVALRPLSGDQRDSICRPRLLARLLDVRVISRIGGSHYGQP
jgi:hypothetical protein